MDWRADPLEDLLHRECLEVTTLAAVKNWKEWSMTPAHLAVVVHLLLPDGGMFLYSSFATGAHLLQTEALENIQKVRNELGDLSE